MLCHILSRAEVMRECDIHHTRAIKTNSAVNVSRKPGLDLCCDLLQHLRGVPRTCSFYIIRTTILLVPGCKRKERVLDMPTVCWRRRGNLDVTSSACSKRRDRERQSFLLQVTGFSALGKRKRKAGKECTELGWQSRNRYAVSMFIRAKRVSN